MKAYNISLYHPFLLTLAQNIGNITNSKGLKKTIFLLPTKVAKIDFSDIFFKIHGSYPKVFVLNENLQDDTPEHFLFCAVLTLLKQEIQTTILKDTPTSTLISLSHMFISGMMEVMGHLENVCSFDLPELPLKNDLLSQVYIQLFKTIYHKILDMKEKEGLVFLIEKRIKHTSKLKSFFEKLSKDHHLIIAGVVATRPFVRTFLYELKDFNINSHLVLSGDNFLTQEFPKGHPCYLIQKLLEFLNIQNIDQINGESLSNIQILKCATQEQEAREIALQISTSKDKKIALITQNSLLRTMVEEELLRYNIDIKQYKTKFLSQTVTGKTLKFASQILFKPFCIHTIFAFLKHINTHCYEFEINLRKQNLPISSLLKKDGPHIEDITSFLHNSIKNTHKNPYIFYETTLKDFLRSKANFCDDELDELSVWESLKNLPPLTPFEFDSIFQDILEKTPIENTHKNPYLIFCGTPLDARLRTCDMIILGDLTDGSWPKLKTNPWIVDHPNIPSPLEYQGLSFLDFKQLCASSPKCLITHSQVKDGKAQTPSAFLQNMHEKTQEPPSKEVLIKETLNLTYAPIFSQKPLKMNASDVKRLISNPYLFYMRKILKLEPLPMLSEKIPPSLLGQIVHQAFENTLKNKPFDISKFAKLSVYQEKQFARLLENFIKTIKSLESGVFLPEKKEIVSIQEIEISSRIDLILKHQGNVHIIDYKTSAPPSITSVLEWENPQLAIEALSLQNANYLEYWHTPLSNGAIKKITIPVTEEWLQQTQAFFEELFSNYKNNNYIFHKTQNVFDTDDQHFMRIEF